MTAEPFASDPLPGLRLDGVTISEAIRLQGEARVRYDDDDLRLQVEPAPDKPGGWSFPTRTAIITLWIVGLIAALAIASYAQLLRQRNAAAAMDIPPPPPEAAPAAPTTPVPPPEPALSQSAPIAAGIVAPDAAVSPPAAGAPEAAAAQTPVAPPAAKVVDSEPPKAKAVEAEPPSKAKVEAKTEGKAEAQIEATAKSADAKSADAKAAKAQPVDDIDHLRRGLNHAYVQAVKAGVPKSVMKQRQAEWAVLYAKARKKSPEAVAALYRTRTTQLEAIAKKHQAAAARP